jgi:mRNA interferase MazF
VELNYQLPNGKLKAHPALVISNDDVLETEDIFYAMMISSNPMNDGFSFELKDEMLGKPLRKTSFVKCQLLQSYSPDEVLSKISTVKQPFFDAIIRQLVKMVF